MKDELPEKSMFEDTSEARDDEYPDQVDFGDELDLHHFRAKDTEFVLDEFFRQAMEKGYVSVRVVHGRGKSYKKKQVRDFCEKDPRVDGFTDDGANWGATVVYLKKASDQ